jgi:hypothetical protein
MKNIFFCGGLGYFDFVCNSASRHEEFGLRSKVPRILNFGGTFS